MKTPALPLRGVALSAAAMISFSAAAVTCTTHAQEVVPAPPPGGNTVIVVPPEPGAPQPVQVEPIPAPSPEPKKKGFFSRLFSGDKKEPQRARERDEPDNDDDGDTRGTAKGQIVIEEAPPGATVMPVPAQPQPQIQGQSTTKTEIRKEPVRKSTSRRSSTIVETEPSSPPKTRMELPSPNETPVVTEERTRAQTQVVPATPPEIRTVPSREAAVSRSTTEIQRPPTIRELPAGPAATTTTTSSVSATAPVPSDQAVLEAARAKTEMKKALSADKQQELEVTRERTTVQPSTPPPGQTQTTTATVESTAPAPAPAPVPSTEQQRVLAETKQELARLKGEVADVKEELKTTKSAPPVNLDKVTIAAPNEAAPITPPEPADAAATPPARAASVAGSEAPTDRTTVKPSEPPGGLQPPKSPPGADAVTIGTSASKESGASTTKSTSTFTSESTPDSASADGNNAPTGTKTDSPNFVRSPFPPHNKLDVTGMKPGALAKDPSNGKVFRVP